MPPSDFSGRGGRCGAQVLSRNSGRPLSISADSASTVAVTASAGDRGQTAGRRPHRALRRGASAAGSGFSVARNASASSSDMSMPGTGLRPAAARSGRPLAAHGGATGGLDGLLRGFGRIRICVAAWAEYGRSGR